MDALKLASRLRASGEIPSETQFWAVANPNTEPDASRLEAKVGCAAASRPLTHCHPPSRPRATSLLHALTPFTPRPALREQVAQGARVILTQPPFDADAFESWLRDVNKRGLSSEAKIIVGMPMLASASNLAFWLALADCMGNAAAQQLLGGFREAGGGSKERLAEHCWEYNERLLSRLLAAEGVAGLHVMPISGGSRQLALKFIAEGRLGAAPAKAEPLVS